jgi:folylpolyglutamate synthase/dihydropteroate synthase
VGEIVKCLPPGAPNHETFGDFESAYHAARKHGVPVLVAGSLYLVGEARAFFTKSTFQPSNQ